MFESRVYLPKLDKTKQVKTIFDYLLLKFPHLSSDVLTKRIEDRKIFFSDKTPISLTTPYRHGITLFYYRENIEEKEIFSNETIIFENEEILVVDKPHFIPVTPSGKYVSQCLLYKLVSKYNIKDLSPIHRLDKDTAGLVIFSKNKDTRGAYQNLFQNKLINRKYYAVCNIENRLEEKEWLIQNRIVSAEPWYKMKIDLGQINAITYIRLVDLRGNKALLYLEPMTGKKHQLRLHLSSLGFNIINDPLYPIEISEREHNTLPMQLLAYSLSFKDPISKEDFEFFSRYTLDFPFN
jgi:tRNA pseudouridine32 synthase/23S rRNA pseudouridine746 synthase